MIQKLRNKRLIKYLIVGGSAFVVEYMAFLLLIEILDNKVALANVLSFLTGLITSFIGQRSWTFVSDANRKPAQSQLMLYTLLAVFNLTATTVLIGLATRNGLPEQFIKLLLMVLVATWNYVIFKKLIFKSI